MLSPHPPANARRSAAPLTVLLVADGGIDAPRVAEMLRQAEGPGVRVLRRERLTQALARLTAGGVDLVLLDLSLPDSRGFDAFEQVRAAGPDVPIVVMGASEDEDLAIAMVRKGAQDYLAKAQVTPVSLARSIRYSLERHRTVLALRELSLLDELTGLYNRRGFLSLAASHLELAQRAGRRFVLLYADLDGLKRINDTYGHRAGDLAIAKAAEVLRRTFRHSDVVARLGGDEFVVLAVEAAGCTGDVLLRRLERHFAAFNLSSGLPYELSLSAGVSTHDLTSPPSLEQMLAQADQALYERKSGRRTTRRTPTLAAAQA